MLLHAITTLTEAPPPSGVQVLTQDGLCVWVSDMSGPFTKADMLEHHRVVSDIFSHVAACLPMRFPTVANDLSALDIAGFGDRLEHVRDACELAVTAVWRPPIQESTTTVTPGRAYLLRRVRAQRIADEIEAVVGDALLDSSRTLCPSDRVALSLAVLAQRDRAQTVKSCIRRTAEDVRILVNGPWPPYTFADRPRLGTRNASA